MRHPAPTLAQAAKVWARIGCLSFGGPAGQIALMHRTLVEEQRWLSERRFLHALNYCMVLPGPEAQQLATYVGWLMHGWRGGLVAGGLFILPGAFAVLVLSAIYAVYGQVGPIAALFFGLKAAVLAIVVQAVIRLAGRALTAWPLRLIAAGAFLGIYALRLPFPVVILIAGLIGLIAARAGHPAFRAHGHAALGEGPREADTVLGDTIPPHATTQGTLPRIAILLALWLAPTAALWLALGPGVWTQIAGFFSAMAVLTFGGAYAVLAWVAQQAVETYGWLAPGEMMDGLGLAETTPGPLILVTQFVGFLAAFREGGSLMAGTLGAALTTWVTFVPSFLFILVGAPFIERLHGNLALAGALKAVTAAVVGVISNLALWFALHVLFGRIVTIGAGPLRLDLPDPASLDLRAAALTMLAFVAVFALHWGVARVLALCAGAGLALHLLAG